MSEQYREQHKKRLSYMPWLYFSLKPRHLEWARAWQVEVQAALAGLENVLIGPDCFIAPEANIFAEPGRTIEIGQGSAIAADCFIHGPVALGAHVSLNHGISMDGGRAGIQIGDHTRIAQGCSLYAFNHGMAADQLVREQPVSSRGIRIGRDVWIGARVCITDGVSIGDGAVIGMGSVVTRDIPAYTVAAGNPARPLRPR